MRGGAGLPATADELRALKSDIAEALGPGASGLLLDPEFALPSLVDDRVVPRDTGILVAVERSGPRRENGLRVAELVLAPDGVRRLGGAAGSPLVGVPPPR